MCVLWLLSSITWRSTHPSFMQGFPGVLSSPQSERLEEQWPRSSAALLLRLAADEGGYEQPLFETELAQCKFAEYPIDTWSKATLAVGLFFFGFQRCRIRLRFAGLTATHSYAQQCPFHACWRPWHTHEAASFTRQHTCSRNMGLYFLEAPVGAFPGGRFLDCETGVTGIQLWRPLGNMIFQGLRVTRSV